MATFAQDIIMQSLDEEDQTAVLNADASEQTTTALRKLNTQSTLNNTDRRVTDSVDGTAGTDRTAPVVVTTESSSSRREKFKVLIDKLHHAAFRGNTDKIKDLRKPQDIRLVVCSNANDDTPLHTACRSLSSDKAMTIQELIEWDKEYRTQEDQDSQDTRLMENKEKNIPLHLACSSNDDDYEMVEALLTCDADMIEHQLSFKTGYYGNTAVHIAAWSNNEKVLRCILNKTAKEAINELCNNNINADSAVHLAAAKGHIRVLEVMHSFNKDCFQNNPGRFNWSALHTACVFDQLEAVETILNLTTKDVPEDEDDPISEMIRKYDKDVFDECCADVGYLPLQEMTKPRINIKYRSYNTSDKEESMTPLTLACMFGHPDIVKYLLTVGYKIKLQHPEYQPIKKAAFMAALKHNHKDCMKHLVVYCSYDQLCDFLSEKISNEHVDRVTTFNQIIKKMPEVAKCILDKCVEFKYDSSISEAKNESVSSIVMKYDFLHTTKSANDSIVKEKHPLKTMLEMDNIKLLKHPVVASFIHNRWNSRYGVANFFYWLAYFLYLIFITCMLVVVLPNPTSTHCVQVTVVNNETNNFINGSTIQELSLSSVVLLNIMGGLMLTYSFLRLLLFELYQCYSALQICCKTTTAVKRHWFERFMNFSYIRDGSNWLELPLFFLSISYAIVIFIANTKSFCLSAGEWQLGVTITCLSWIELILISRQFKLVGVQSQTFWKVFTTLIEFVPFAIFLFAAFGLSFYLLLYQSTIKGSPYSSPSYSMLSVYAMLGGYLDLNSVFGLDGISDSPNLHLYYEEFTFLFWTISLLIITIILTNIMIGLAVENISEIYKAADFERLKLQVHYIVQTEAYETLLGRLVLISKPSVSNKKEYTAPYKDSLWNIMRKYTVFFLWGGSEFDSKQVIREIQDCQSQWPVTTEALTTTQNPGAQL